MRVARKALIPIAPVGTFAFGILAAITLTPSRASAQAATIQAGCTSSLVAPYNSFSPIIGGVVGATNSISSVISTMNTAFQAQGDAFAVGLANPQSDQIAGGVWGRLIGGRVENHASGTFNGSIGAGTGSLTSNFPGGPGAAGSIDCKSDIRQDYAGFQIGQDLAQLNLSGSGATLHVGLTGGFAQSRDQDLSGSGFSGGFQVPFAGIYAVYTNGNFFADGLLRADYYQMNLTAASAALGNQNLNGFGLTETISAGYKIDIGNNWFVQPSVSGIHSDTKIDTLYLPGGFGNTNNPLYLPPATVNFSGIQSYLGRAGIEVGTTFTAGNVVWEPFATASIWHEFAGNITASYTAPEFFDAFASAHAFFPCVPGSAIYPNGCGNAVAGSVSATRVGTFGQYSLGVFGEIPDTPWLGYFRLDYKDGANIEALGFNAGVRYQFDPTEKIATAKRAKAAAQTTADYDWSGVYAGAFTGAAAGITRWNFQQAGTSVNPRIAGVLGGGTLGYNRQFDRWVLGVEADAALTNATGGQACLNNVNNFNISQNCNDDIHVLASFDARLGYTWFDRLLVFTKLGGAWTDNGLSVTCNGDSLFFSGGCFPANNPIGSVQTLHTSDPRFGYAAGGGFEFALSAAWSAKLEYDYLDFGSKSLKFSDGTVFSVREYFNELTFGLNYHFNADAAEPGRLFDSAKPARSIASAQSIPSFNWAGLYAGATAAYRMVDAQWDTVFMQVITPFAVGSTVNAPDPSTDPGNFPSAALQGGFYVGYDWQLTSKWVSGIEGDMNFGNSNMERAGIPGTYGNGSAAAGLFILPGVEAEQADSAAVKLGWDASIRARLGYLTTPNVLVYGTGGVAFQEMSMTAECNGTLNSYCRFLARPQTETITKVKPGWTIGGGVESILSGNWTGKLEFRYADFNRLNYSFFGGTLNVVDVSLHAQTYTALAGIGYKFNGSGNLLAP
ncbi:MAG TPA: outer membrane beta-barrel protein [Xanthobacteraceae bacterium]|jgi:opacity protein-like surface antigen|nr:outer membrane beta-barrel protein [Xanthobacteraceae bacterium]